MRGLLIYEVVFLINPNMHTACDDVVCENFFIIDIKLNLGTACYPY